MPWKQWQEGDVIAINRIMWDGVESEYIQDVLERDWFGPGHYANLFEKSLSDFIGTKHAQLTNSGSSALLLGAHALQYLGKWNKGDLILHPACTFPTSCNPIWQTGMIPVFVDVEEGTYNIDLSKVENALKQYPKIKGAIIPHLIGNSPKIEELVDLLGPDRPVIEDCCDTLGSMYNGRMVGTFGVLSCFSFYGSHHISTAGVGGALLTDNDEIARLVKSMAFWGRQFVNTGDPYFDFTQRYTYETLGFDMQMSEIQAAFGLAQMSRIYEILRGRYSQFWETHDLFLKWPGYFKLPEHHYKATPSWFGYPVTIKDHAPFNREGFARHLLEHKIEIRPLFAGNITKQPAYKDMAYIISGDLTQSNRNMEQALFLPCWEGMTEEMTLKLFGVIKGFMREYD